MSVNWTTQQVLALSPDASSTKSGQVLANPHKWVSMGMNDISAWGECQGSGKNPYQVEIDLREPAFKCTCPSRKFPCKHALGLFLILTGQPKAITQNTPPAWVSEWLSSRDKREEKKETKKEKQAEKTPDPTAQAKRAAGREAKVAAGMQELETWLYDLIRNGLANAQTQPYQYWDKMAARMVDSQSAGLARMLREMAGVPSTGSGWQSRLLERISKVFLLLEAYKRIGTLSPDIQAEVRSLIGWTQDQDELLSQEGLRDRWLVMAQRVDLEDKLKVQRTWLWGEESHRPALVLSFAHGTQPLDTSLVAGTILDADVVFYPGCVPIRAIVKTRHTQPMPLKSVSGFGTIEEMLRVYAHALSQNPWIERFPTILENVIPVPNEGYFAIRDRANRQLDIDPRSRETWQLLAVSGGHPVTLFGEWDGKVLVPMSMCYSGRYYSLIQSGGVQ